MFTCVYYIFAINPLLPFSDQHMAEVVQDSGCSDLIGFAPLTDAFLSSHAQENMIEPTPSSLQPL